MNYYHDLDPKVRARKKFYQKVRAHLEELHFPSTYDVGPPSDSWAHPGDEHQKCGLIKANELEAILDKYEKQQTNPSTRDKPVLKCDTQVAGGSFGKLLYSRPGFHQPSSTDYLVQDLKISDANRNSLLGGPSGLAADLDNCIGTIKRRQQKMYISEEVKLIIDQLDLSEGPATVAQLAQKLIDLEKLDAGNLDLLVAKARLATKSAPKNPDLSIRILRDIYHNNLECSFSHLEVARFLSESLCEKGMIVYHKGQIQEASLLFFEALSVNSNNKAAEIHYKMCRDRLDRGFGSTTSWARRK